MIILKGLSDRKKLEESGRIVGLVLDTLRKEIKEGITTLYLDEIAKDIIYTNGGIPAFKNYRGFPFCICASINEAAVHGFPDNRLLQLGDVVSIDTGVLKNNFYGDAAFTCKIGCTKKNVTLLLTITKKCLYDSISLCVQNNRIGDIGNLIQNEAKKHNFTVIKKYGGHGVGRALHEEPHIPNYGYKGTGPLLKPGMVIAIEPILSMGNNEIEIREDGWTVATVDKSLTAHFEHTVMITEGDPVILTNCNNN